MPWTPKHYSVTHSQEETSKSPADVSSSSYSFKTPLPLTPVSPPPLFPAEKNSASYIKRPRNPLFGMRDVVTVER